MDLHRNRAMYGLRPLPKPENWVNTVKLEISHPDLDIDANSLLDVPHLLLLAAAVLLRMQLQFCYSDAHWL